MDKVTILYNTCDKYECLWEGFFILLEKYWHGEIGKIILNTETKNFSYNGLNISRPRKSGKNVSWSQRILNSLEEVDTPYVLMMLDDFYIKSPVDLNELGRCVERMDADKNIKTITFAWQPGPNKTYKADKKYECRGRWARYRINAQIALWRVDYLRSILRTYENPWQFEISGSFRSSLKRGKLLSVKKNMPLVFDYDYGFLIVRGAINKKVADYFEKNEGITLSGVFAEYKAQERQDDPCGKRMKRFVGYGKDMLISLVKK